MAVLAAIASPSFDVSVWQLLGALVAGGRVCVVGDGDVRDPARLLAHLARQAVTVAEVVPSVLRVMVEEARRLGDGRPPLALRWLLPSGEALQAGLLPGVGGQYPAVPLLNAYGADRML